MFYRGMRASRWRGAADWTGGLSRALQPMPSSFSHEHCCSWGFTIYSPFAFFFLMRPTSSSYREPGCLEAPAAAPWPCLVPLLASQISASSWLELCSFVSHIVATPAVKEFSSSGVLVRSIMYYSKYLIRFRDLHFLCARRESKSGASLFIFCYRKTDNLYEGEYRGRSFTACIKLGCVGSFFFFWCRKAGKFTKKIEKKGCAFFFFSRRQGHLALQLCTPVKWQRLLWPIFWKQTFSTVSYVDG